MQFSGKKKFESQPLGSVSPPGNFGSATEVPSSPENWQNSVSLSAAQLLSGYILLWFGTHTEYKEQLCL